MSCSTSCCISCSPNLFKWLTAEWKCHRQHYKPLGFLCQHTVCFLDLIGIQIRYSRCGIQCYAWIRWNRYSAALYTWWGNYPSLSHMQMFCSFSALRFVLWVSYREGWSVSHLIMCYTYGRSTRMTLRPPWKRGKLSMSSCRMEGKIIFTVSLHKT